MLTVLLCQLERHDCIVIAPASQPSRLIVMTTQPLLIARHLHLFVGCVLDMPGFNQSVKDTAAVSEPDPHSCIS